jgi:type IV secretory pathway VirB6-like protein
MEILLIILILAICSETVRELVCFVWDICLSIIAAPFLIIALLFEKNKKEIK